MASPRLLSWITHVRGSQLPCCEDPRASQWGGPQPGASWELPGVLQPCQACRLRLADGRQPHERSQVRTPQDSWPVGTWWDPKCCFKPLHFGEICYSAMGNKHQGHGLTGGRVSERHWTLGSKDKTWGLTEWVPLNEWSFRFLGLHPPSRSPSLTSVSVHTAYAAPQNRYHLALA